MSGSQPERPASYSGLHNQILPHDERVVSATSAQLLPFRTYNSEMRPSTWTEQRNFPPMSPTLTSIKQPARSFFHSSNYRAVNFTAHTDSVNQPAHVVRDQTAELASYALSEAAHSYQSKVPLPPLRAASSTGIIEECASPKLLAPLPRPTASSLIHETDPINEESEPVSPTVEPGQAVSRASHLTHLLRNSSPQVCQDDGGVGNHHNIDWREMGERTSLLCKGQQTISPHAGYNATDDYHRAQCPDIESQDGTDHQIIPKFTILKWPLTVKAKYFVNKLFAQEGGKLSKKRPWGKVVLKPVWYLPAVILGLLLNVLDGLSYGMILFPLGQPIFSNLGVDGLSMFYVSCIISQLVYSCGGSVFKGGVGSEMIEIVPFFHKMAFTILAKVGEAKPRTVLATTILSFSISSVITGMAFFLLGYLKLGSLTSFFPRHILLGCIGGVGWFLVATGIEVSARLDGNLGYNLDTLKLILEPNMLAHWGLPLLLAILLTTLKHFIRHQLLDAFFFITILCLFYITVVSLPNLDFPHLREGGWVFEQPPAGVPFWHFYTLYDFNETDWNALLSTVPAMFALTFFGILHVPINVPALGVSTGEDNLDVNRELIAHGVSNALSGFCGSIQNYLVYTNSVLFIRSGGDSRIAGVMLAIATVGIWMIGPVIIGYIPVMVVGALIFYLGIELLREALCDTWGKLHRLEYLTIVAIVVTMGAWDFVIGILIGIVLACVSYVVQTSQKSPIQGTYTGVVARSTVRRHPIQQHFLQQVGRQIYVMKLTGYMFFGTITSVERTLHGILNDYNFKHQPIRYLVIDLSHVTGIDFSAAEAFTRIRRQVSTRNVELVLCGVQSDSEVGKGLQCVGVWSDESDRVEIFVNLNAALEACENELLTTFYRQREVFDQQRAHGHDSVEVPNANANRSFDAATFSSPRKNFVYQAAASTLQNHVVPAARWQNFKQPLPLILQTFQDLTDKNEDFWFFACPYFRRLEFPKGTVIFRRGAKPDGFYLLEDGMFRADYDLEQGKFSESIVAGTTCGELPFFSDTPRTATVVAEKRTIAWVLDEEHWGRLQNEHPKVAYELMKICLKLTSERLSAITSYILTTSA